MGKPRTKDFSLAGYRMAIHRPGEPRFQYVVVAEKALGKRLPPGAEVHHVNEDKSDDRPENLVICQSRAYHMLLHQRTDALNACGHADWLKCPYCKTYDEPKNLHVIQRSDRPVGQQRWFHKSCAVKDARASWLRRHTAQAAA